MAVLGVACGSSTTETTSSGGTSSSSSSGNASSSSSGSSGGISAADACAHIWKARCDRNDACSGGFINKLRYGDTATCEARNTPVCVEGLAAPGTANTPAGVDACAQALPSESCVDLVDNSPVAACQSPAGMGATSAACGANAQCASAFCLISATETCGTCQPKPVAGSPCQSTAECGTDLTCPNSTSVCTAFAVADAPCDAGNPCAAGLSCVGSSKTVKGACKAAVITAGAPCDGTQKADPTCDRELGLGCSSMSKTCVAIALAKDGQPCGDVGGVPTACAAGGQCVHPPMSQTGTCKAPAADGMACDDAAGPPCLQPAKCVPAADGGTAGTCVVPDPSKCK